MAYQVEFEAEGTGQWLRSAMTPTAGYPCKAAAAVAMLHRLADPEDNRVYRITAMPAPVANVENNWSPEGPSETYCKFCGRDTAVCEKTPCQGSGGRIKSGIKAAQDAVDKVIQ